VLLEQAVVQQRWIVNSMLNPLSWNGRGLLPICIAVVNGNLQSRTGNSSCNSGVKQAGKYPLMVKQTKLPAKQFYRGDLLIPGSAVKNITR